MNRQLGTCEEYRRRVDERNRARVVTEEEMYGRLLYREEGRDGFLALQREYIYSYLDVNGRATRIVISISTR